MGTMKSILSAVALIVALTSSASAANDPTDFCVMVALTAEAMINAAQSSPSEVIYKGKMLAARPNMSGMDLALVNWGWDNRNNTNQAEAELAVFHACMDKMTGQ
jgi:hypothetical protein